MVVGSGEDTYSLYCSAGARPEDKRQSNKEAQCIARPERAESSLPPDRFWLRYTASAAAALTEGVTVRRNEPIERPPKLAEGEPLSRYANEPGGREQTRQTGDSVPAYMDFAFGGDNMQLPQALLHPEPEIGRG
jgi:hypothetical protein